MAKLYFYYSAMNAGKSTTLLQAAHNYEEQGMKVLLFTPVVDDRAGVGTISSRIGLKREAYAFDREFDLLEYIENQLCVRGRMSVPDSQTSPAINARLRPHWNPGAMLRVAN